MLTLTAIALCSFTAGAAAITLALRPWHGTGKRRAGRAPEPSATPPIPVPAYADDDTVRIPLLKLLDVDSETTLQIALPAR